MKLKIDFDKKVIELEDRVNLGEFFDKIVTLFPRGSFKEFTLEVSTTINWTNPVLPMDFYKLSTDGSEGWIMENLDTYTGVYNIEVR